MAKYVYPAVFYAETEGGYSVIFPDIDGCYTQGETMAEALEAAEDAAVSDEIYTETLDSIDFDALAKRLIDELSEDEKMLYNLRYIRKNRVDEIALILNISRPAASMRLVRLKTKITDMVTHLDFEKGEQNI